MLTPVKFTAECDYRRTGFVTVCAGGGSSQFKANGSNITEKRKAEAFLCLLLQREGDERYNFENDDLGFVDTESGALLKIGMSSEDVEKLIGAQEQLTVTVLEYTAESL